jgi:hypothetical protein
MLAGAIHAIIQTFEVFIRIPQGIHQLLEKIDTPVRIPPVLLVFVQKFLRVQPELEDVPDGPNDPDGGAHDDCLDDAEP